ncbi:MAG TPA: hypothetical protein VJ746_06580 [Nitrospira sp.]|nr:hypothetical protein [Nitrospira sp.]
MTRIYLYSVLFVVAPIVSMAETEPVQQMTEQAECYSLPQSLQTVVAAMSAPGQNMRARAVRDKRVPLIPLVQRVNVTLLPAAEVSLQEIRRGRTDGSSGPFAGLLAFEAPQDGVYRISLGARTWVTVLDRDHEIPRVRPVHRLHRCGPIHKSNEFALKKGNMYWIELSGSEAPTITLLISPEEGT